MAKADNDTPTNFKQAVKLVRHKKGYEFEEGFGWLADHAPQYVSELVEQMQSELDPQRRWVFVELLGLTKSRAVVPVLAAELSYPDAKVQWWAKSSLLELGFKEAKAAVWWWEHTHPQDASGET